MAKKKLKNTEKEKQELTILNDPPEEWSGKDFKEFLNDVAKIPELASLINEKETYLVGWYDECCSFEQMRLYHDLYVTWGGSSSSAVYVDEDVTKKYVWDASKNIPFEKQEKKPLIEYTPKKKQKVKIKKVKLKIGARR